MSGVPNKQQIHRFVLIQRRINRLREEADRLQDQKNSLDKRLKAIGSAHAILNKEGEDLLRKMDVHPDMARVIMDTNTE